MQQVLRVKDIQKEYGVCRNTATKLFNEFIEETEKEDSKIPSNCYLCLNEKLRWVNSIAFYYFVLNKNKLEDEKARNRLKPFNVKDFINILN